MGTIWVMFKTIWYSTTLHNVNEERINNFYMATGNVQFSHGETLPYFTFGEKNDKSFLALQLIKKLHRVISGFQSKVRYSKKWRYMPKRSLASPYSIDSKTLFSRNSICNATPWWNSMAFPSGGTHGVMD